MTTQAVELTEYSCPLCRKPLASDEYHRAIAELRKKVSETYDEQSRRAKRDFERKLQETLESHKAEIANLKKNHEKQRKSLEKEIEASYKKQLKELEKYYDKISMNTQRQFNSLEQKLRAQHKRELQEKNKQLTELRKEQSRLKQLAFQEAKANAEVEINRLKNDIRERDIQIKRFEQDIDELKKQISKSQAELKGEAGEIDLYATLTHAFEQDFFRRQKRGTASGDIIQQIRTATGTLDTPIVYDNKQAEAISRKDTEKAKNYKRIHGTNYVIIVSSSLPKKDVKNGLFGEKDGILLVHPSIVVEVAKQIRNAIIEISRQAESKKDREAKESKLYDYIRSQDFTSAVEKLHNIYQKMAELQDREEKAHGRLWKERRALQSHISQAHIEISSGVDSIVQEKPPMEELTEGGVQQEQTEEPPKPLIEPLAVKTKRRRTTKAEILQ